MSRVGVQRCAETPLGCHLQPERRAVEGGSKQEASGVMGSRWRRLPTLLHGVSRCAPTAFAAPALVVEYISPAPTVYAAPASVVEYITAAPAASYAAPAPAVFAAPVPVVEQFSSSCSVYRTSSQRGVHIYSASGKLRRASAYSYCCNSSCRGTHFSSSYRYAAPVEHIASHRQCTLHMLLSTLHQHWRELQRIRRCTRGSLHSRSR